MLILVYLIHQVQGWVHNMASIAHVERIKDNIMYQGKTSISGSHTLDAGESAMMVGPTTVVNLTVNGTLSVLDKLTHTGALTIGSNGKLRIV